MKIRIARHTTDLDKIASFYCGLLGFEKLGGFSDHQGYDGIFIGLPDKDWHLEFTISHSPPNHNPDNDDLLVFYLDNNLKLNELRQKIESAGVKKVVPDNPYWADNGITYEDPDGFRIVITIEK